MISLHNKRVGRQNLFNLLNCFLGVAVVGMEIGFEEEEIGIGGIEEDELVDYVDCFGEILVFDFLVEERSEGVDFGGMSLGLR